MKIKPATSLMSAHFRKLLSVVQAKLLNTTAILESKLVASQLPDCDLIINGLPVSNTASGLSIVIHKAHLALASVTHNFTLSCPVNAFDFKIFGKIRN